MNNRPLRWPYVGGWNRAAANDHPIKRRRRMKRSGAILVAAMAWTPLVHAAPVSVLFVGNSFTFARVAPALQYNAGNVHDLTAGFNAIDPSGTNSFPVGTGVPPNPCLTPGTGCFEPHNWG